MPSILDRISNEALIDFSRHFVMNRPAFDGDKLFPDVKTEYLVAEYERLAEGSAIPSMALVHAFDTEANIGSRPTAVREAVEKLYVKEKLNLSERESLLMSKGVSGDAILKYIYNDVGNLMDAVRTRSEVAKMEIMTTGKMTVKENNLNITIDYGVPSEHIVTSDWTNPEADILGDILKWLRLAEEHGVVITDALASTKVIDMMCANKAIQAGINGTANAGVLIGLEELNGLLSKKFDGLTVHKANRGLYKFTKADGTVVNKPFFDEAYISFYQSASDGSVGNGLWGTTPEEIENGPYTEKNSTQFITAVKWKTPDPVATWTKASGLMVPVLPNPYALVCAKVTGE